MIHAASLVAHALGWPDAQAPRIVPTEVSSALRARAERLVSTTDGVFERSDGRPLAYLITDGMLMRVQQAVDDTGDAAEPKLSGLARKRLMAWVVVDVVCSPVVLPKASADKAGGRIWMQAKRVSAMVTTTSDTATSNRDAAHAAAAADPSLEAGLAAELAEIDATEQVAIDRLLTEVYTGFTELESRCQRLRSNLRLQQPIARHPARHLRLLLLLSPRLAATACATSTFCRSLTNPTCWSLQFLQT